MCFDFFNVTAPIYDRFALNATRTWRQLKSLTIFRPSDRVLDLGGGSGRIAQNLIGKVAEITVIDPAPKMIARCKRRQGLRCKLGSATQIDFPDQSFDKIILVDAFHHFPQQKNVLIELRRVLTADGQLIFEEFDPRHWFGALIVWLEKLLHLGSQFYSPDDLKFLLEQNGFQATYHQIGGHYYLIAYKRS